LHAWLGFNAVLSLASLHVFSIKLVKPLKNNNNPYLKILDVSRLFATDAPMKKKIKKLVLPQFVCVAKVAHAFEG